MPQKQFQINGIKGNLEFMSFRMKNHSNNLFITLKSIKTGFHNYLCNLANGTIKFPFFMKLSKLYPLKTKIILSISYFFVVVMLFNFLSCYSPISPKNLQNFTYCPSPKSEVLSVKKTVKKLFLSSFLVFALICKLPNQDTEERTIEMAVPLSQKTRLWVHLLQIMKLRTEVPKIASRYQTKDRSIEMQGTPCPSPSKYQKLL